MEREISILLVDDSEVVRLGLRSLLSMYPEMKVVGEAGNAQEAIRLVTEMKPQIILMDVRMPCCSGVEACRKIRKNFPATSIIMLTSYDDDDAVYESIMAGASGFVLKEISSQDLIRAIEQVADGKSLLDPSITGKLLNRIRSVEQSDRLKELTHQEKQVLQLIAQGKTNREISDNMILSEKTVRNYVTQVLAKLELKNRAEAAVFAVRYGR